VVRRSPSPARLALLLAAHLAGVAVVGAADYVSGPDFDLRLLYLFPVVSAAWFGGRALGLAIAVATTLSLFLTNDYLSTAAIRGIAMPLWNTISRLAIYGVVTVLTSELRRQSDALRVQSEELRHEAELREEYIALFVHELRHSAAAMSLASASLASSPRLTAEERSFLGRLRQQAGDLEHLAGHLLAMGRLEGRARALNLVTVDLDELAAAAAAECAAPERVDVRPLGRPALVLADPEDLRRAFDNYLRNALKFSPQTSCVMLEVIERGALLGVEVSDRGAGFEPADARLLFRKYGRLRGSQTGGTDGAGLGLYLTRLIVEAHGGLVEASSPGRGAGARFRFLLPRADRAAPAGHADHDPIEVTDA